MSTSNVAISTRIKLNRQSVTFQDAIVSLSTSIATLFPLIGVKGRKALVSETGTGGEVADKLILTALNSRKQTGRKTGHQNSINVSQLR